MSEDVAIYALVDPRTGAPRYIGATQNPEDRLASHIYEARNGPPSNRKEEWICGLTQSGGEPEMRVLERVPEEHRRSREREVIRLFSKAMPESLLNEVSTAAPPVAREPAPGSGDIGADERSRIHTVLEAIAELESGSSYGAKREDVVEMARRRGVAPEMTEHVLEKLKEQGRVYSEKRGRYRRTG